MLLEARRLESAEVRLRLINIVMTIIINPVDRLSPKRTKAFIRHVMIKTHTSSKGASSDGTPKDKHRANVRQRCCRFSRQRQRDNWFLTPSQPWRLYRGEQMPILHENSEKMHRDRRKFIVSIHLHRFCVCLFFQHFEKGIFAEIFAHTVLSCSH